MSSTPGSDDIIFYMNILAGVVASFSGLVVGYIWYSVLFAKKWQKLSGVTDAQLNKGMLIRIIGSFAFSLIMSLNLAAFIGPDATPQFGLFAGMAAGIGWVAAAFGNNYLFEHRPIGLFFINAGYNIVILSLMGLIIGLF